MYKIPASRTGRTGRLACAGHPMKCEKRGLRLKRLTKKWWFRISAFAMLAGLAALPLYLRYHVPETVPGDPHPCGLA